VPSKKKCLATFELYHRKSSFFTLKISIKLAIHVLICSKILCIYSARQNRLFRLKIKVTPYWLNKSKIALAYVSFYII